MLTLIEAISLAGDRKKQNDDAYGFSAPLAWVIDGATDLYEDPAMGWSSDAAWFAHHLNAELHRRASADGALRAAVAESAEAMGALFRARAGADLPGWREPAASLLLMRETETGVEALDLGDSRMFARDSDGASFAIGGKEEGAARETAQVRALTGGITDVAPLERADVIARLRASHEARNKPGGWWVMGLYPACADHARAHALTLSRPAHLLIATDGFSALVDRYALYDAAGLIDAALTRGLAALGAELRAFEEADAGGAQHPRYKKSDDATALLLRLG